jgi:hypothetical protein
MITCDHRVQVERDSLDMLICLRNNFNTSSWSNFLMTIEDAYSFYLRKYFILAENWSFKINKIVWIHVKYDNSTSASEWKMQIILDKIYIEEDKTNPPNLFIQWKDVVEISIKYRVFDIRSDCVDAINAQP